MIVRGGGSGGGGLLAAAASASLPAVILDHVSQLDDELSLFVLLTALKGVFLQRGDTERSSVTFDLQHSQQEHLIKSMGETK